MHLPRSQQEQAVAEQHQCFAEKKADFLAHHRQMFDQGVHAQMPTFMHGHHRTYVGQPDKEVARHFIRNGNAGVEGITQHHVAENHDDHGHHADHHQQLQQLEEPVDRLIDCFLHDCFARLCHKKAPVQALSTGRVYMHTPPSQTNTAPVVKEDSSDNR